MIELISSFKYQGETNHYVTISIDGRRYQYLTSALVAERFAWMLKKGGGYKALNYLKKNSTQDTTYGMFERQQPQQNVC